MIASTETTALLLRLPAQTDERHCRDSVDVYSGHGAKGSDQIPHRSTVTPG